MRCQTTLQIAASTLLALASAQNFGRDLPDAKLAFKRIAEYFDDSGPLKFQVSRANLTNARQGSPYSQHVGNLVKGIDGKDVKFSVDVKGQTEASWVSIFTNGTLFGTPPANATDTLVKVVARAGNETARANFTIPMRPCGAPLAGTLKIMSFNLWFSGLEVDDFADKQLRFIINSGADIVGFQEDFLGFIAPHLAEQLGWYVWTSRFSISILSRYPIEEVYGGFANKDANLLTQAIAGEIVGTSGGVRIAVDKEMNHTVNMIDLHLTSFPYGPDAFCFDKNTTEQVMKGEEKRVSEVNATVQGIQKYLDAADDVPVFLTGDFNAPSHLDWTKETADAHCGVGEFRWPTSLMLIEVGLSDSLRTKYPDPVAYPAITFSPVDVMDLDTNQTNPMDRIDFVYHKGKKTEVANATLVGAGEPKQKPNHGSNELPSDHLAVLVTYNMKWQ